MNRLLHTVRRSIRRRLLTILVLLAGLIIGLPAFSSPPSSALAAPLPLRSLGFAPNNIWYSKEPFFAGETVRVHTLVVNSSPYDLSGAVEFFIDEDSAGVVSFHIRRSGGSQELSIPWEATRGAHEVYARIISSRFITPDGDRDTMIEHSVTGKSSRTVLVDTDRDGAGDDEDEDDDNDGLTDVFELSIGADPLVQDDLRARFSSGAPGTDSGASPPSVPSSASSPLLTPPSARFGVDSALGFAGSATRSLGARLDALADGALKGVQSRRTLLSERSTGRSGGGGLQSEGGLRPPLSASTMSGDISLGILTALEYALAHRAVFYILSALGLFGILIGLARRYFFS